MSSKWKLAKVLAFLLILIMNSLSVTALPSPLNIEVFNPGKEAVFPVTSSIVYGDKDAALIDAQFQAKYARQLVKRIQELHRDLKFIYISHSDPDYYFGLNEIKKAFPDARVVSTAQTAYLISATKDAKLDVWKEKLGADAPEGLLLPEPITSSDALRIEGQEILIKQNVQDSAHSFLWIPSLRTVLGGISVLTDGHLWMADTPSVSDIDQWIDVIDLMKSLKPSHVIPGHFLAPNTSPAQLDFVRDYLSEYRKAAISAKSSSELISKIAARYPTLGDADTLAFGAKVFTGEAQWHVASPYPPIGKYATVKFGDVVFRLNFVDNRTMSFEGVAGQYIGVKDRVQYTAVEVAKKVFMVYWHEPSTGSNVVHVQDWNSGTAYTNIAAKDNSFVHLKGTIRLD